MVFERRMKPVFDALGIELLVRNIAQGANNCFPSNLCYEAMGGSSPDWVGWEQSYNCGKANNIFELLARVAGWSKGVVYYSASGAFTPIECEYSNDTIPWITEAWTPEVEPLPLAYPTYRPNNVSAKLLRDTLDKSFSEGDSVRYEYKLI